MNTFRKLISRTPSSGPSEPLVNELNPIESKQFEEFNVEIYGAHDEPLFKAIEIGEMLGLVNIRETIKDYNSKQKVISSTDTVGGLQKTTFLTEIGLYKVIFKSKKKFADRKSTRLNSSHERLSRMPSSA